jgi:hypothetical protein
VIPSGRPPKCQTPPQSSRNQGFYDFPEGALDSPIPRKIGEISTAFEEERARQGGWDSYTTKVADFCQEVFPDVENQPYFNPMTVELPGVQRTNLRRSMSFRNGVSIALLNWKWIFVFLI